MKRFITHTTLFILSVMVLYLGLYVATTYVALPPPQNDYMASMIDKHQRAKDLGSPRILIAGGSNIAFNINSEKVQEEFGLPVVNLGLNIGLGIRYFMNELDDLAEEGDIVLIFPTWYTTVGGTYPLMRHTVNHYPESSKYFRFNLIEEFNIHTSRTRDHTRNMIASLIRNRSIVRPEPVDLPMEEMYSRDNFNEFGDFEGHHDEPKPDELDQRLEYTYRYWEGIRELNRFHNRMAPANIHLYYFFPAYPITEFEKNRDVLERFAEDLSRDLKIPQPIDPEAFLFDEEFFFDTTFHLTKEGRELRTEILIERMRADSGFMEVIQNSIEKRGWEF